MSIGRRSVCVALGALWPTLALARSAGDDYLLLILCDAAGGREAEFDIGWSTYLRQLARLSEVTRVEDFRRAAIRLRGGAQPLPAFLGVVSVHTADFAAWVQALGQQERGGALAMGPAVDPASVRLLGYRETGVWSHPAPEPGDQYLQLVFAEASPGRSAEYTAWFREHHGPELTQVPGVVQVTAAVRVSTASASGGGAAAPTYLSAMRFETPDILRFKDTLESAAKTTVSPSSAYDLAHAWRETYARRGAPIDGVSNGQAPDGASATPAPDR
ncbi:MAG TPA: hypothetical protein VMU59_14830 [Caulobacteraceae bacterium]|nr:hypothetical protein [Caulobacteraceae bacterium]